MEKLEIDLKVASCVKVDNKNISHKSQNCYISLIRTEAPICEQILTTFAHADIP